MQDKDHDQSHDGERDQNVQHMPGRQHDGRARHVTVELCECNQRTGEGNRADRNAERHLDQTLRVDRTGKADAIGSRRIKCGSRNQYRGKAN